ncbi:LAMI_0D01816g1_1 [Lachancea mirantina]|uniref:LAMI_0D01816g1_1 n=1 Tax=Lachancea mirantina TaxID=1230905 RepID=A0A1G4J952_9SACH|nr:LAMI_0D01816g1_1 [Lachancea mirantina]
MDQGASLAEQLLEASRRNNTDLLQSVIDSLGNDETKIAELINDSKDPMDNTALHICCQYGSWEILDKILDQNGEIEIDPRNSVDGDTPLHVTVRYALGEPEHGTFIAQNLLEVGADPRIKNKAGQKPLDLIHGDELDDLIDLLQGAEIAADNGGVLEQQEVEEIDDGPEDP